MEKIMIIDDEKEAVNMLSDFLSQRGYVICIAMDGEEALNTFDNEKPDILLCDIRMPKMDGFELIRRLRSNKKWVPVVIISALTDPSNIMKGYSLEADYYLTKPIDMNNVIKAIRIMSSLIPLRKQ